MVTRSLRLGMAAVALWGTHDATAQQRGAAPTAVKVRTGVVTPAGEVKPLALFEFEFVSQADSNQRTRIQTDLDGAAEVRLSRGDWSLRSVKPSSMAGRSLRWDLPVRVAAAPLEIQVTTNNAITRGSRPANAYASAAELYRAVAASIVRVQAGLGHGSGFLVDEMPGLVVTNDHVVGTAERVIVQIDSVTSVFAHVLLRDTDLDLAVLRFNEHVCSECPGLPLSRATAAEEVVTLGEPLVAIGFPLSQRLSISQGIASSVRDGAIIHDVQMNTGNSGGPLLNLYGEVVGVNTFVEEGRVGAGIGGSVVSTRLWRVLDSARVLLPRAGSPAAQLLPVAPSARYAMSSIRVVAESATVARYKAYEEIEAGPFTVSVHTPVSFVVAARVTQERVAAARRDREQRAGVASSESYSELRDLREWRDYVGDETAPLVGFKVNPKPATRGGLFGGMGRVLTGRAAERLFQGDVRGVQFARNGSFVQYVYGGHAPVRIDESSLLTRTADVADFGFYALLPEVFEPEEDGTPPVIELDIADLLNPALPRRVTIPPEVVASIWNDFVPYFRQVDPGREVRFAVPPARRR